MCQSLFKRGDLFIFKMLAFSVLLTLLPLVAQASYTVPGPHCMVYNGCIISDAVPFDFNELDKKLSYDLDYNLGENLLSPRNDRFELELSEG